VPKHHFAIHWVKVSQTPAVQLIPSRPERAGY